MLEKRFKALYWNEIWNDDYNGTVLVKDLMGMTDDVAKQVYQMLCPEGFNTYTDLMVSPRRVDGFTIRSLTSLYSVEVSVDGYLRVYHEELGYVEAHNLQKALDYIRIKSYFMPFYDLSIDDIKNSGWIKIWNSDE